MNENSQERQVAIHGHLWLPVQKDHQTWLAILSLFPRVSTLYLLELSVAPYLLTVRRQCTRLFLREKGTTVHEILQFLSIITQIYTPISTSSPCLQKNVFIPPSLKQPSLSSITETCTFYSSSATYDATVSLLSRAFVLFLSPSSTWRMLSFSTS